MNFFKIGTNWTATHSEGGNCVYDIMMRNKIAFIGVDYIGNNIINPGDIIAIANSYQVLTLVRARSNLKPLLEINDRGLLCYKDEFNWFKFDFKNIYGIEFEHIKDLNISLIDEDIRVKYGALCEIHKPETIDKIKQFI